MGPAATEWVYAKRGSTSAIRTGLALTPEFVPPFGDLLDGYRTESGEVQARELAEFLEDRGCPDPDLAPVLEWQVLPQRLPIDFPPSRGSWLTQYGWPSDSGGHALDFRQLEVVAGLHGDLWSYLSYLPAPFTRTIPLKVLIQAADALSEQERA
jgi:hypothetical protein